MWVSRVVALMGLIAMAAASPLVSSRTQPLEARQSNTTTSAPCAQVSQYMYSTEGVTVQQIPAEIAWNCINSVPFNATSGKKLLQTLRPYIQWQSTLDVLKNPPTEYAEKVQPPIDILGGLDLLDTYIDTGRFQSEYDFGWSLYTLIQSAHDGHFSYIPDSVGEIFTWGRPVPLVSVSADGEQLPAVFVFADVLGLQFNNISYTPSPVVEIDGQEVTAFLEDFSQYGSLQDRDALYNNLFYELAQVSLDYQGTATGTFAGGGRGRWVYPGATTTLRFANGSEYTMHNYAVPHHSFLGINTGEDLANQWFSWGTWEDSAADKSPSTEEKMMSTGAALDGPRSLAPGYPPPIVAGAGNLINGFYMDAEGYQDVAVLQVPNFVGNGAYGKNFQNVSKTFIPKALADGKTKLIIDLQANGGGTILQGYDLFKQLFPDQDPYGASRFRAIESVDLIGKAFSAYGSQYPRVLNASSDYNDAQSLYFDYHTDMHLDGTPFSSWGAKFGPEEVNGAKYTTPSRWNLNDPLITITSGGIDITGYGRLANVTGPPKFKPENIVIVTDGYCASTCTIFAEFLTKQAGVKTIAMGGRSNKNAIQAIGGVKGVNNYQLGFIQGRAQQAIQFMPVLQNSSLADYSSYVPFNRLSSAGGGVNVRDGLAKDDKTGTALQFVYEEADCRLYYTPQMTVDITALWQSAYDAAWSSNGKCVAGGIFDKKQKRSVQKVTTQLTSSGPQVSAAEAAQKVQAFEKTFELETDCKLNGNGFMHP